MIVLYGNGYDSQDLVGRMVNLIEEDRVQPDRIIAVNHYGFMTAACTGMLHWFDEEKTWTWINAPEGHR